MRLKSIANLALHVEKMLVILDHISICRIKCCFNKKKSISFVKCTCVSFVLFKYRTFSENENKVEGII